MKTQRDLLSEALFKAMAQYVREVGQDEFDCLVYLVDDGTVKTWEQLKAYGVNPDGTMD